jgi:hypothetical protein
MGPDGVGGVVAVDVLDVNVPVGEEVEVALGVCVDVGVCVAVGVRVGVLVGPLEVWITSCGAFAPSRLEKLILVLLVVLKAKLYTPFPVIWEVTSTVVHVPPLNAPEAPSWLPIAGALL